MMPPQADETLVAYAADRTGVLVRYVGKVVEGATVRSMIARVDASHANARRAYVVGEFTSDGTRWPVGHGRTLASREPRVLDDGTFYSGWVIE